MTGRLDCDRWRVGATNVGIPCGWGNASTIEEFEAIIIDATRSTGKVSQRTENVAELFAKGYLIFRRNR